MFYVISGTAFALQDKGRKRTKRTASHEEQTFRFPFFSGSQSTGKCLYAAVSSGPATRLRGVEKGFFFFYLLSIARIPSMAPVWRVTGICRQFCFSPRAKSACFGNC